MIPRFLTISLIVFSALFGHSAKAAAPEPDLISAMLMTQLDLVSTKKVYPFLASFSYQKKSCVMSGQVKLAYSTKQWSVEEVQISKLKCPAPVTLKLSYDPQATAKADAAFMPYSFQGQFVIPAGSKMYFSSKI